MARRHKTWFIWMLVLLVVIAAAYIYKNLPPKLPDLPSRYEKDVLSALDRSGDNRKELVKALASAGQGDRLIATCDIISRMPRYDLANMDSRMLIDHVNCTLTVNKQVPWRLDTNSRLFRDYVLPNRVTCESLECSRREIMRMIAPQIRECKNTKEAVAKVITFAQKPVSKGDIYIGSAYPYDYPPLVGWRYGRLAFGKGCRAQAVFLVAALRSVCIPACVLEQAVTLGGISDHTEIAYFDISDGLWHPADVAENVLSMKGDLAFNRWAYDHGLVTIYGKPPHMSGDYIGQQRFDELPAFGTYKYPSGELQIMVTDNGKPVANARIGVYIWCDKLDNWYLIALSKTDDYGHVMMRLGNNVRYRPYMISSSKDNRCAYEFVTIRANERQDVYLDLSEPAELVSINIKAREKLSGP